MNLISKVILVSTNAVLGFWIESSLDLPIGISSIVSGTIGAIMGSREQRRATEQNRDAAERLNELNYRMFLEGRGSTGNALLPLYMGGREQQLGQDAMGFYDASKNLLGTPQAQFQRYNEAIGAYQPTIDAARGALGDVFNGNLTNARLEYARPVAEARNAVAATQKQGVLEGLQERLNALNTGARKGGYAGTGSFAQNRLLNATIGARQQAAGVGAAAGLANAEDTRGIYDNAANLRLQMMNMPFQQAQNALALDMLPISQVQQNFTRSLAPFEFFRMSPGAFQASPLPQIQPDTTWPAVMAGIGNANQQVGQYFANQQAQKNYLNYLQGAQLAGTLGATTGYGTPGWGGGAGMGFGADVA